MGRWVCQFFTIAEGLSRSLKVITIAEGLSVLESF